MSMTINAAGGGSGLNYSVVGDVVQPTPKENIIWVNTGTPVKGYSFARTAPSAPVNGDVWFRTTTNASAAEFNALKKNELMVYPQSCFQYEGGEWVEKAAMIYKDGAWVEWYTYFYYLGDQEQAITGGWKLVKHSGGDASFEDDCISLGYHGSVGRAAQAYTTNKVDVTGKESIKFEIELVSSSGGNVYCGLSKNNTANEGTNNLLDFCKASVISQLTVGQKVIVSYDISGISDTLADLYYVRVGVGVSFAKIYRVWCE